MKLYKKTLLILIFSACIYLFGSVSTNAAAMTGNGTASNPYMIQTVDDLYSIPANSTAYYKLSNDLDMKYSKKAPLPEFRGNFDGNGYTIKNLNIASTNNNAGLFSILRNAVVKNVNIINGSLNASSTIHIGMVAGQSVGSEFNNIQVTNVDITGNTAVGGICGFANSSSQIINCSVKDSIIIAVATQVGGVAGNSDASTIRNCNIINSKVKGPRFAGGMVGYFQKYSFMTDSYVDSSIITGTDEVGGLIGYTIHNGGDVTRCHVNATVTGGRFLGGILGSADANLNISKCSSRGIINGNDYVGGFIGHNHVTVNIDNSYTLCEVISSSKAAGFGGYGTAINVSKCFSAGSITGAQKFAFSESANVSDSYFDQNLAGIQSPVNLARTTAQLYQRLNYSSWDFLNIWSIDENNYPYLQSEVIVGAR